MAHSFRELWYRQGLWERMPGHRRKEESALQNSYLGQSLQQRRHPSQNEACAFAATRLALRMSYFFQAMRQRPLRHRQVRHGPRRENAK